MGQIENPMASGYGYPLNNRFHDPEFDARAVYNELREEEAKERPVAATTRRPRPGYHQNHTTLCTGGANERKDTLEEIQQP